MPIDYRELAERRGITEEEARFLHTQRGLTAEGIAALPERSLMRALRRVDYPDAPRARQLFRLWQSRDEQGRIPDQPVIAALRELAALREGAPRSLVARLPTGGPAAPGPGPEAPEAAGLDTHAWTALGPGNVGGRTRAIVVHPSDPGRLWAASVGGGIWSSADAGASWAPVDDFMANLAVTAMVMDPDDPDTIYAGTGEGFGNIDALRGGGVFRTTDGVHWAHLAATTGPAWGDVTRLALSANGSVLLSASTHGLQRSDDPVRATWQQVLASPLGDVKCHPTNPMHAVAGGLEGDAWFTADGGVTWTQAGHAAPWAGRVELGYATANPDVVYASVANAGGEIWRSTDGGQTYAKRASLNVNGVRARYLGDQGWYDNVIWAGDPTDADLVIVGGVDLWRSTDGGDLLLDISTWWDSASAHADHHAIVSHPAYDGVTNRVVYFGNDGGVYRADDVRSVGDDPDLPRVRGWTALNNSYAVTQFYGAAGNASSGVIVAGAQDNGTLALQAGAGADGWSPIFGGDGGFCCADQNDTSVFYGEYVFLNIHRNTDGATTDDVSGDRYISGQFWNTVQRRWDWKPTPFRIPDAFNQRALFIAPFVLDPNASNRMLAGGESLWRTSDARTPNTPTSGPRWTSIKAPSTGRISAIAIAPGHPDEVWVGYDTGEVARTSNATSATPIWVRVDGTAPGQFRVGRFCHQVCVSPHAHTTVFAAFGGFASGNLWRTVDGGATWTDVSAGVPRVPIRAVAVHPAEPGWWYVGTEVGVFASEDLGATWSPANEGPANVSVDDLFWMGTRLVCVTHGRGLFEIDLA